MQTFTRITDGVIYIRLSIESGPPTEADVEPPEPPGTASTVATLRSSGRPSVDVDPEAAPAPEAAPDDGGDLAPTDGALLDAPDPVVEATPRGGRDGGMGRRNKIVTVLKNLMAEDDGRAGRQYGPMIDTPAPPPPKPPKTAPF